MKLVVTYFTKNSTRKWYDKIFICDGIVSGFKKANQFCIDHKKRNIETQIITMRTEKENKNG